LLRESDFQQPTWHGLRNLAVATMLNALMAGRPLAEMNNREELEEWLRNQRREVAVAFAARSGLRVLPRTTALSSLYRVLKAKLRLQTGARDH
jgi:hypothetical protein